MARVCAGLGVFQVNLKTDFSEWNKKVTRKGHGKDKLYLLRQSRIDGEDCEAAYELKNN